jgi:ADP-ribosyl-[dinitrogen reductase] hydrolase
MSDLIKSKDQYRGCLLDLAIGDALGATLELCRPSSFIPVNDIVGGGPFNLKPGEWTDDTSMVLCLAESLITRGEFYHAVPCILHYKEYLEQTL